MAEATLKYGTTAPIAITLNGLLSSATAGRKSVEVDWTALKDTACMIDVTVKADDGGTIAVDKAVYVWIARSVDGTVYEDNLAAGDDDYTLVDPCNIQFLGAISVPVKNVSYTKSFLVTPVFPKFVLVVRNYSQTVAAAGKLAAAGNSAQYRPMRETVA